MSLRLGAWGDAPDDEEDGEESSALQLGGWGERAVEEPSPPRLAAGAGASADTPSDGSHTDTDIEEALPPAEVVEGPMASTDAIVPAPMPEDEHTALARADEGLALVPDSGGDLAASASRCGIPVPEAFLFAMQKCFSATSVAGAASSELCASLLDNAPIRSFAEVKKEVGERARKVQQTKRRLACLTLLVDDFLHKCLVFELKISPSVDLVCLIELYSYDETPLRVAVRHGRATTAGSVVVRESSDAVQPGETHGQLSWKLAD